MSAWKGKWENASSGKQLGSVQEGTGKVVDNRHNRPLLLQRRRHRLMEESLRKALAPGEKVLLEGKVRKRAQNTSRKLHKSVVYLLASSRKSKLHI